MWRDEPYINKVRNRAEVRNEEVRLKIRRKVTNFFGKMQEVEAKKSQLVAKIKRKANPGERDFAKETPRQASRLLSRDKKAGGRLGGRSGCLGGGAGG